MGPPEKRQEEESFRTRRLFGRQISFQVKCFLTAVELVSRQNVYGSEFAGSFSLSVLDRIFTELLSLLELVINFQSRKGCFTHKSAISITEVLLEL
jgi:hypothetical protein